MQLRIANSIASADWSYAAGQLVDVGAAFTPSAIPADIVPVWLDSGLVTATGETETASLKPAKKAAKK